MANFTDEELANLTDEEREGLMDEAEDEGTDEGTGDEADDALDATTDDGDDGDDGEDGDDDADDTAGSRDDGTDDEPATTQPAATEPEPQGYKGPMLNADVPADVDAKLADIQTRKDALIDRFDEGDLTTREYHAELDKLAKEERAIEQVQYKAQLAAEMRQDVWVNQTVAGFLAQNPAYKDNEVLYHALDNEVRKIQAKAADPFSPKVLQDAHERIRAAFGAPATKPAAGKPARRPINAPPTLASVPASSLADTDDGRFAAIDRLLEKDPHAWEERLAKMSDADRESYLASR